MAGERAASAGRSDGSSPFVIGVAGGSGSGKTTVVRKIADSLGPDQVTVLDHDRYYRDRNDLRLEERATLNWDHPDSLETDLLVRHVLELKHGRAVEVPTYDFARYARRPASETALPRRAISSGRSQIRIPNSAPPKRSTCATPGTRRIGSRTLIIA